MDEPIETDMKRNGWAAAFFASACLAFGVLLGVLAIKLTAPGGKNQQPSLIDVERIDLGQFFDWEQPLVVRFVQTPDVYAIPRTQMWFDDSRPEETLILKQDTRAHGALVAYLKASHFQETYSHPIGLEYGPNDPIPNNDPAHLRPQRRAWPACIIIEQTRGSRRIALQFTNGFDSTLVNDQRDYRYISAPGAWQAINLMLLCEPSELTSGRPSSDG